MGLYWDNGEENGNYRDYRDFKGSYRDSRRVSSVRFQLSPSLFVAVLFSGSVPDHSVPLVRFSSSSCLFVELRAFPNSL